MFKHELTLFLYFSNLILHSYFKLQLDLINRTIKAFGLHPVFAVMILFVLFFGGTYYLYQQTVWASEIQIVFLAALCVKLSTKKRNDFLKLIFQIHPYRKLRMLENLLVSLPSLFVLLIYQQWLYFFIGIGFSLGLSFLSFSQKHFRAFPTPFSNKPFEFTAGFRITIFAVLLCYLIVVLALLVTNFNLAAAALAILFFCSYSYLVIPEPEYFIWIYKENTVAFLVRKWKQLTLQVLVLTLPAAVLMVVSYPSKLQEVLIIEGIGCLYLLVVLLGKYASYPNEINLPITIIISLSFLFPPFLLFAIPFLYAKSRKNISPILS